MVKYVDPNKESFMEWLSLYTASMEQDSALEALHNSNEQQLRTVQEDAAAFQSHFKEEMATLQSQFNEDARAFQIKSKSDFVSMKLQMEALFLQLYENDSTSSPEQDLNKLSQNIDLVAAILFSTMIGSPQNSLNQNEKEEGLKELEKYCEKIQTQRIAKKKQYDEKNEQQSVDRNRMMREHEIQMQVVKEILKEKPQEEKLNISTNEPQAILEPSKALSESQIEANSKKLEELRAEYQKSAEESQKRNEIFQKQQEEYRRIEEENEKKRERLNLECQEKIKLYWQNIQLQIDASKKALAQRLREYEEKKNSPEVQEQERKSAEIREYIAASEAKKAAKKLKTPEQLALEKQEKTKQRLETYNAKKAAEIKERAAQESKNIRQLYRGKYSELQDDRQVLSNIEQKAAIIQNGISLLGRRTEQFLVRNIVPPQIATTSHSTTPLVVADEPVVTTDHIDTQASPIPTQPVIQKQEIVDEKQQAKIDSEAPTSIPLPTVDKTIAPTNSDVKSDASRIQEKIAVVTPKPFKAAKLQPRDITNSYQVVPKSSPIKTKTPGPVKLSSLPKKHNLLRRISTVFQIFAQIIYQWKNTLAFHVWRILHKNPPSKSIIKIAIDKSQYA